LDDLMTQESDTNFEWSLVQLDRKELKNKKGQKETSTVTVYVKRAPLKNLNAIALFDAIEMKKHQRLAQTSRPPAGQEQHLEVPSLPRRAQTTLEDVVAAQKRRVEFTLKDIDRSHSAVDASSTRLSQDSPGSQDDAFTSNAVHDHEPQLDSQVYDQRLDKYGRAISATHQEEQRIVVGIDFGMTYSGVAWAYTERVWYLVVEIFIT
jgi:hypothetical protein